MSIYLDLIKQLRVIRCFTTVIDTISLSDSFPAEQLFHHFGLYALSLRFPVQRSRVSLVP